MAGKCSYIIIRICTECPHPDFHPSNGLSLSLGNPRIGVHSFDVLPWWQNIRNFQQHKEPKRGIAKPKSFSPACFSFSAVECVMFRSLLGGCGDSLLSSSSRSTWTKVEGASSYFLFVR